MNNMKNTRLTRVSTSILVALTSFNAMAEVEDTDLNQALNQSFATDSLNEAQEAFYEQSSTKLHTFLYIRDREEKNENGHFTPQIENQTLQLALDYKSGYFHDVLGVDIWVNSNLKLGTTTGMSEILYYDFECIQKELEQCEKSYSALSVAALKAKFGGELFKVAVRGGYTRLNMGTIRSGWGLNPHAYRGAEAKISMGNFHFGYAIADQFKNDWDKKFRNMTNTWHQNRFEPDSVSEDGTPYNSGLSIDYIHSLGASYDFENGVIDLGYGEGKEYRKNWQALAKYSFDLGGATLNTAAFYHGGKYIAGDVSGISNPENEYYVALGADLIVDAFEFRLGLSNTHAPNSSSYNFRLTPWGNSDNRNSMQATSQIEDYNVDGTKAIKLGVSYNFKNFGIPGLNAGISTNYGWNILSDIKAKGSARTYDGTMKSVDWNIRYEFQKGDLKGLNVRLFPARFRSKNTNYKADRNDMKLMFLYSYDLK